MAKTIDESCSHADICRGCKLWYCADDELHHCKECHDCLNICEKCSGAFYGQFEYLCKQCYRHDKKRNGICVRCNKSKRIMANMGESKCCKRCYIKYF